MKKSLLVSFVLFCCQNVMANHDDCQFTLFDERGLEVASFEADTCNQASDTCERERRYQIYNNLIRSGMCQKTFDRGDHHGPGDYGQGGNGQYGQFCQVNLETTFGQVIQQFSHQNCDVAQMQCNHQREIQSTPYQSLFCRVQSYNQGGYNGGGYSMNCQYRMVDSFNGQIVNTYVNSAQSEVLACQISSNQCESDARLRNGYGNYGRYLCQKVFGQGNGQPNPYPNPYPTPVPQPVNQSCAVKLVSGNGQIVQILTAQAVGRNMQEARQQACGQAQAQCMQVIRTHQIPGRPSPYTNARCEIAY